MSDYYLNQVKEDVIYVINEIAEHGSIVDFKEMDDDEIRESLEELLWDEDSVTGNGSGSYTFDTYKAYQHVTKDWFETVIEAVEEGSFTKTKLADCIMEDGWETLDVVARCYVLNTAIYEVLNEHHDLYEKLRNSPDY